MGQELEKVDEAPSADIRGVRDHSLSPATLTPDDFKMYAQLANTIAGTEFVPGGLRGSPHKVLACLLYGKELGIGPMQSLSSINVIDGVPQPEAEFLVALVRSHGMKLWRTEERDEEGAVFAVTAHGERPDGQQDQFTFSMIMAQRAGLLTKLNWIKYPEAMMWARAVSQLCRILFPDIVKGLGHTPEELEEPPPPAEHTDDLVAVDTEPEPQQEPPADEPAEPAADEATTATSDPPPEPETAAEQADMGDYDDLEVAEILERLVAAPGDMLPIVREYEEEGENRQEILDAIDELLSADEQAEAAKPAEMPEPWPDYSKDNVSAIKAKIRSLSSDDVGVVLEYERAHKKRAGVIDYAEQQLGQTDPAPVPDTDPQGEGEGEPPFAPAEPEPAAEPEPRPQRTIQVKVGAITDWAGQQVEGGQSEWSAWTLPKILEASARSFGGEFDSLDDLTDGQLEKIWNAVPADAKKALGMS